MNRFLRVVFFVVAVALFVLPTPVLARGGPVLALVVAYGGPGSVISGIGAFLAAVAALVATLFGFLWFPLKRLYRRLAGDEDPSEDVTAN